MKIRMVLVTTAFLFIIPQTVCAQQTPFVPTDFKAVQLALTNLVNKPSNEVHKNFKISPIKH
ncbi:MAG: hypothetical protein ACI92X_002064 [Dokdonia sp.]|jgi:hypothetical protein